MSQEFYGPEASRAFRDRLSSQPLSKISDDEEAAIKQKMAAVDKLFADQVKAKYRLEIQFSEARSVWKPFAGVMYFLLNGNRFHGGGDSKVYLCADTACYGVIDPTEHSVVNLDEDPEQIKPVKVVCPKCRKVFLATELWGERCLNLVPTDWAKAVLLNFGYLGNNADVSLTFHHKELQSRTFSDLSKNAGGDILNESRRWREKAVYPLRNIIKDTSNGADLYDRFLAFIKET